MSSIMGKAKEALNLDDEVIARNMFSTSTASANAYLNGLLSSATPEVRSMYASSLNQIVSGHSALTELIIKRNWANPYVSPKDQLYAVSEKIQTNMQQQQQQ